MKTKRVFYFSIILIALFVLLSACSSLPPGVNKNAAVPRGQTGVAELDKIISITSGGNVEDLRSLLSFTQTRCTTADGLGGPPKCLDGEEEGTPVEVLPILGPEGHFVRKNDLESWNGVDVSDLFAVYQVSEQAYSDENYPAGEYAVVFKSSADNSSITLQVRQGRIVRVDYGSGYPPEIRPEDVTRYLLPPTNAKP